MLTNKNIIITGCSRGIGNATLELCAKYGANIIAINRAKSATFSNEIQNLAKQYGVDIKVFYADFSNEIEVKNAADEILKLKIKLDGLVNNIGIVGNARLFSMTKIEEIKEVFQVNVFSPLLLTQRLLKNMTKHKSGSIVNISSVVALDGNLSTTGYIASKASIIGITKRLSSEFASFNIRINTIAPSVTDTDIANSMNDNLKTKAISEIALKRVASPYEIAEVITFLLSSKSSFINGETIRIDGGRAML